MSRARWIAALADGTVVSFPSGNAVAEPVGTCAVARASTGTRVCVACRPTPALVTNASTGDTLAVTGAVLGTRVSLAGPASPAIVTHTLAVDTGSLAVAHESVLAAVGVCLDNLGTHLGHTADASPSSLTRAGAVGIAGAMEGTALDTGDRVASLARVRRFASTQTQTAGTVAGAVLGTRVNLTCSTGPAVEAGTLTRGFLVALAVARAVIGTRVALAGVASPTSLALAHTPPTHTSTAAVQGTGVLLTGGASPPTTTHTLAVNTSAVWGIGACRVVAVEGTRV